MKLALSVAVVGLVASLVLAPRWARGIDEEFFWDTDPAVRAARGEELRSLGVALAGYEDLVEADPDDLDALRKRIHTGMILGAVAMGQEGLEELVMTQVESYLKRRDDADKVLSAVLERVRDGDLRGAKFRCDQSGHPFGAVARRLLDGADPMSRATDEKLTVALSEQKLVLESIERLGRIVATLA